MLKDSILIEIHKEPLFRSYAAKMNPRLVEEILSEVIITIAEMNDEKVISLYESNDLNRYIITIITNMVINTTSPLNKMYAENHICIDSLYSNKQSDVSSDVFTSDEAITLIDEMKQYLARRSEINEEEAYNSALFYRSYFGGETYQEISDSTGITKTSVFNTVKEMKKLIEHKFKTQYSNVRNS